MQMPERTPTVKHGINNVTSSVRLSNALQSIPAGLVMAGCCGAQICLPTPLGPVCHCAGVESPFC
jgi:hypothetical protein